MKKLLGLFALGFSAAALAQGMPAFEEVDANQDGAIDQTEAAVVEGLDFATADADQDGQLSREEYEALSQE